MADDESKCSYDTTSTSNFYLAAVYLCKGERLIDTDRDDPRHIKFVFAATSTIEEVQQAWDEKSLMVNAREYADAIREIKLKIHQD
jgi:Domain of unknown function (DUF5659)